MLSKSLFRVVVISLIVIAGIAGGVSGGLLANDIWAVVVVAALIAFGVYISLLFAVLYALSFLYADEKRTAND